MARRDYGTGSITQRGDGWYLRWWTPPDLVTGERKRKVETFHGTKREASARLAELAATPAAQTGDVSLGESIRLWRSTARHELGTARNYDLGELTIPAPFMARSVSAIRAEAIKQLIDQVLAEHGVSRARLVHAVLSGGFTYAWRQEWIVYNPARRVPIPAAPARAETSPSVAEVMALLDVVATDPQLHAWIRLSAVMGSRRSEVLGLRRSRLDLARGEVRIAQTLDPIDFTEKDTKTRKARTVAIGPATVEVVQAWYDMAAVRASDVGVEVVADPFVLSDAFDCSRQWRPDVATKRFGRLRDLAGISAGVRLNDLRHFVASELLGENIDPKTVGTRLGHTRTQTTTDVYGHVLPARDREASDVMERKLRRVV